MIIYTHSNSPATKEFWKFLARAIVRKYSGPQAVRDSLKRGLTELGVSYRCDPLFVIDDTVVVLSGVAVLRTMIKKKRAGKIKKLLAGPNIVSTPNEYDAILADAAIDTILVPSQWVADLYHSRMPALSKKVRVWPAGVSPTERKSSRVGSVIVYCKMPGEMCQKVQEVIAQKYHVTLFTYNSFTHQEYLDALLSAPAVVYLSPSESQGLALQEAWMHDVPTLVYQTKSVTTPLFSWSDEMINAPYLIPEYGAFFQNPDELPNLLESAQHLHPHERCQQELSDNATTKNLIQLLQEPTVPTATI